MKRWMLSLLGAALTVAAPVAAQEVFFGSLHAHTSYSDGSGTPDDAYKAARAAGLDFYAITEHNHKAAENGIDEGDPRLDGIMIATTPALYRGTSVSLIETADRLDDPDDFVTLYGQEFSTIKGAGGNHVNVFGVQDVIDIAKGRYDLLAALANSTPDPSGLPPLIQMNHPNNPFAAHPNMSDYGRNKFGGHSGWLAAMDPLVELIEVLSGPATEPGTGHRPSAKVTAYLGYLDLGFHAAPSSGQDTHLRNWGSATTTRTAVIANSLSRADIVTALRNRHAYATEDPNLSVIFRANGALQGDIVPAPLAGSQISLSISIRDDDEPSALYRIDVLSDLPSDGVVAARVSRTNLTGNTATPFVLPAVPFRRRGQYVLLRVTQTNAGGGADRAWTAPVWFE
jgi:hypothetical protein